MLDLNLHRCQNLRTHHFFPDNANGVQLNTEHGASICFFDLPYDKAHALALLFADADTKLFFHGDYTKPLLENLGQLEAMKANDAARQEAEAVEVEAQAAAELEFQRQARWEY